MFIITLRKVALLLGVTLFVSLCAQQALQLTYDAPDDLKRLSIDDSEDTYLKKALLVEKNIIIPPPILHKQDPRINRHTKDIHSWIERLGNPMPNDDIISSSEATMIEVAQLAASQSDIYYQLLNTLADLPHGEHRIYLQRILAHGTTEQIKAVIEELLYHDIVENRVFAINLLFELDDTDAQTQLLNTVFNIYLSEIEQLQLLKFLADAAYSKLANSHQDSIKALYEYSENPNIKNTALEVLLNNTSNADFSVYDLLVRSEASNHILSVIRNLAISDQSKLGNIEALVSQLSYMGNDPSQSTNNKLIISDILTLLDI
ncbi:hypothetical protein [Pseudoalteromonas sp. APC 3355]|uniref:hypothetical protein n=1 Tax=Pseudoalteromonas sp. APC 3355 TaxID=3035199 RepID=UPI0025B43E44|nr:hypothetical protein [Pseudoalteromonas sp. APC 3355]MDN3476483.1 hypothetical protein [Pseudoalteromonas sp. APC 3355]